MADDRSEPTLQAVARVERLAGGASAGFPLDPQAKTWQIAEQLPTDELNGVAGCTPLQVQILHNRQIHGSDAVKAFLGADWRATTPAPHDLDRAATRIYNAVTGGEHIIVFGDYDCDGLTSCALLTVALRRLGADVAPIVPLREDDGRGLNSAAVDMLAERGATLIITTDCGTANVDEIELARSHGIDVIVTDHHPPHGPLPQAYALINPRHPDDCSTNKDLAGVGVAFRLAERILTDALPPDEATRSITSLLDLVAVGTIGDVVALSPENWALARAGLRQLSESPRAGLLALIRSAKLRPGEITARDISFSIAPRLNAAGRQGDPRQALDALLTDSTTEADAIAGQLDALNQQRQASTDTVLSEARLQVGGQHDSILVAVGDDWPYGVLGLVAGRLSEEHRLPAVVISRSNGECRGSARAPQGYDLGKMLAARPEFFRRFGGHAQAAGFTLDTDRLDDFLAYLRDHFTALQTAQSLVSTSQEDAGASLPPVPSISIDCRLPLRRVARDVVDALTALLPFGPGFEEPVFLCEGARILRCWPSGAEGRNLRLVLRDATGERTALWPRKGHLCDELRRQLPSSRLYDVAYSIQSYHNRYNDALEIVPRIVDIRAAPSNA